MTVKADSSVVTVWWLWMAAALMTLPLPVAWAIAVGTRGLDSVLSSGISGGGFALISGVAVLALLAVPLFVIVSALYAFLFWNRRRQGVRLGARFWIPLYGSVIVAVTLSLMVFTTLTGTRRPTSARPAVPMFAGQI